MSVDGDDDEGEYLLVCGEAGTVPELLLCFSQAPSVRTEVGPVGVETVSCGSEAGQCWAVLSAGNALPSCQPTLSSPTTHNPSSPCHLDTSDHISLLLTLSQVVTCCNVWLLSDARPGVPDGCGLKAHSL